MLSSKLTWQQQFPSLWLHLVSIAQSYVVSGVLHKAFNCFSTFKWIPNGSPEPLLFSTQTLLENIFVQALERSGSLQSCNNFFFLQHLFPLPYMTILLLPFCRKTLFCNSRALTLSRWTHEISTSGQVYGVAQVALHDISRGLSRGPLQEQQPQPPASAAALPLRSHVSWTQRGGEPDHRCLWHTGLGESIGHGIGSNLSKRSVRRKLLKDWCLHTVGITWQVVLLIAVAAMRKSLGIAWRSSSCFKTACSIYLRLGSRNQRK